MRTKTVTNQETVPNFYRKKNPALTNKFVVYMFLAGTVSKGKKVRNCICNQIFVDKLFIKESQKRKKEISVEWVVNK